ncbi:MAG: mechanosensitive ion channel [Polyangiaceae bacterium]|nr:mechanosensitive ion channel [Myxococcales bacterium]MCB9588328.1 mechanosensitive ion channel [Polyangiaceae bacterium]
MSWAELLKKVKGVLDIELVKLSDAKITLGTVIIVVGILVLTHVVSKLIQAGIKRALHKRGIETGGGLATANRLTHYAIMVIGVGVALQTAGIKIGALFAAGAVFAVGFGFAMQNIAQNFVSGVILLIERSIHAEDIVELNDEPARIIYMGIRSTLVETLDGESLIVPNSTLVQATVKNYTLRDSHFRVRIGVGVSYSSDMKLVRKVLEEVVEALSEERKGQVFMTDFGSSSVDWEVAVWTGNPWRFRMKQSEVREAIWEAFAAQGIVISFPQVDVHFDPPVAEGLARLGKKAA